MYIPWIPYFLCQQFLAWVVPAIFFFSCLPHEKKKKTLQLLFYMDNEYPIHVFSFVYFAISFFKVDSITIVIILI